MVASFYKSKSSAIAEISAVFEALSLPSNEDFVGASAALLRLQRTFALQTDDVAEGRILDEPAAKPLAADDFEQIGKVALEVCLGATCWGFCLPMLML